MEGGCAAPFPHLCARDETGAACGASVGASTTRHHQSHALKVGCQGTSAHAYVVVHPMLGVEVGKDAGANGGLEVGRHCRQESSRWKKEGERFSRENQRSGARRSPENVKMPLPLLLPLLLLLLLLPLPLPLLPLRLALQFDTGPCRLCSRCTHVCKRDEW